MTTSDCQINTEEELNRRAYRIPLNTESKVPRLSLNTPLVSRNLVRLAPTLFYEGDLLEGVPHGEGALIDATLQQVLYQGQWQNGQFHGLGTRHARGALAHRLCVLGLRPENIAVSRECTVELHDKYWSHRYTSKHGLQRGSQCAVIEI